MPQAGRLTFLIDTNVFVTLPANRRRSWSYDACVDTLVRLLHEAGGKPLTERRIASLVKGRTDMPSASTIDYWARKTGTTLTAMREEAAEIRHGRTSYAPQMDTPPAELDQAAVVDKFSAQFEAVTNLRAYAWTSRPKGRASGGKVYRNLIFVIFARATLTYRAALHLCRGGYTEQADMLNARCSRIWPTPIGSRSRSTRRRQSSCSPSTPSTARYWRTTRSRSTRSG